MLRAMLTHSEDPSAHALETFVDPAAATRELDGEDRRVRVANAPKMGDRLDDKYRIRAILGSGSTGTVYLAHDEQLDRDVAIKLLHSDMRGEDRMADGFLKEARAMARVRHPNVVTIYAFGARQGHPYFAMEYIPGQTLAAWQRRNPLRSPAEALAILDPLVEGVQAIHDAGAVHRDLKPGNVLVTSDSRIAVTDFGLAHPVGTDAVGERMPLWGTPAYLAPEIARGEVLEPGLLTRIDIYALGVISFELLTGTLPFAAPSLFDLLNRHAFAAPPRPSEVRPTLPAAFDAPLMRALAKNPTDRPKSAEQLREALHQALRSVSSPSPALRVMVVDDESSTLAATRELLMMTFPEIEVITVADAASAEAVAAHERLDLVITDLNMPHGGGAALTCALRANPATAQVPIVVVTAYGGASDWQLLREMGADRFLVKPVELDMLESVVRALTDKDRG